MYFETLSSALKITTYVIFTFNGKVNVDTDTLVLQPHPTIMRFQQNFRNDREKQILKGI